jgi:hypothetical protein
VLAARLFSSCHMRLHSTAQHATARGKRVSPELNRKLKQRDCCC